MGRITRKKEVENSENNIPAESCSDKKPSDPLNPPIVSAKSRCKRMAFSDKTNAVAEKDDFSPPITRTKGSHLKDRKATYTDENVSSSPKKPLALSSDKNVIHLKAKDAKQKTNNKRKAASEKGKDKENVLLPAKRAKTRNQAKVDLKEKSLEIKANAESESKDEVNSKTDENQVVIRPNILTETVSDSSFEKEVQFNQDLGGVSRPVDKLSSQGDNDEYLKAYENDCKTPQKGSKAALIPRTRSRTQLRRQRKSKYDSDEWVTQKSEHKSRQSKENIEVNDNVEQHVPCDSPEKKINTSNRKSPKSCQSSNKVPALLSHSSANELSGSAESHSERPARVLKKGFLQRIAEKMGESVIVDESKDSAGTKPSCSSDLTLEKPSAFKKKLRTGKPPSKGKEIKSKVVSDSKQGAGRRKCVKATPSKMCPVSTAKSPLTPHPLPPTNLFSLFRKPDTPRRLSNENKIFVSACEGKTEPISKGKPIYAGTKITPIRRKTRAEQEIDGLYEFEVDENEPKPTKKPRRIMKIQRMRGTKKKKRKEFVVDPEMEMKVLRTLELSPSVLNVQKSSEQSNHLPPRTGEDPPQQEHDDDWNGGPSSDVESCDEHEQFKNPPRIGINSSTPYTPRYSASPAHFQLDTSTHSALNVSAIEYRVAPSSAYSPVKSKDSPIPVFLANEVVGQRKFAECGKQLPANNVSAVSRSSGYSVYHTELDIGASTPVRRFNDSTTFVEKNDIPDVVLNVSNCFGFDEPEIMEEPLVSPIKSTIRAPIGHGIYGPAAILKKKLPVVPPPAESASINVKDVIKQLRFEVGEATLDNESANASVFEDFAPSPIVRSPLKKFLQSKGCDQSASAMETTTLEDVTAVARKPRFSYERPKLRKRPIIWDKTDSEASATELDESSDEEESPKKIPTRNRKVKPSPKKKKGMTKKEEEELEKWAKMFNSQCEQVDNYGLCVE